MNSLSRIVRMIIACSMICNIGVITAMDASSVHSMKIQQQVPIVSASHAGTDSADLLTPQLPTISQSVNSPHIVESLLGLSFLGVLFYLIYKAVVHTPNNLGKQGGPEGRDNRKKKHVANQKNNQQSIVEAQAPENLQCQQQHPVGCLQPWTMPQNQQLLQQSKTLGIANHLLSYIKNTKKIGNITFMQLKTISQFNKMITWPVKAYQDNVKRFASMKNGPLTDEDAETFNSFEPTAVCPSLAARHTRLLYQFFVTGALENIANLNNEVYARNFFSNCIRQNQPTSWLQLEQVGQMLPQGLQMHVTGVCLGSGDGPYPMLAAAQRKMQQRSGNNAFHIFIVETGDVVNSEILSEVLNAAGVRLTARQKVEVGQQEQNKNHFYVVAIEKRGDQVYYYIVDSDPGYDHINSQPFVRDAYLCDLVLYGQSQIDYRAHVRNHAEYVLQTYLRRRR